ncbi:MAG: tetratricopeptide repeat protein [Candidatus Omnitrophota bacterium]|jgi:Flp pilus assembly protein TadD
MIEIGKKRNYIISAILIAISFIALRPALAYLLYRRAGDYMSARIVPDAARTYEKTLAFNGKDVDSRNWLAYCYSLMGRDDKALIEYKKAIELDPDNAVALFDVGMMYKKGGDIKTAKEYFSKAASAGKSPNVTDQNYKFYTRSAKMMLEIIAKKEKGLAAP